MYVETLHLAITSQSPRNHLAHRSARDPPLQGKRAVSAPPQARTKRGKRSEESQRCLDAVSMVYTLRMRLPVSPSSNGLFAPPAPRRQVPGLRASVRRLRGAVRQGEQEEPCRRVEEGVEGAHGTSTQRSRNDRATIAQRSRSQIRPCSPPAGQATRLGPSTGGHHGQEEP